MRWAALDKQYLSQHTQLVKHKFITTIDAFASTCIFAGQQILLPQM
jgi:hypothetical protein